MKVVPLDETTISRISIHPPKNQSEIIRPPAATQRWAAEGGRKTAAPWWLDTLIDSFFFIIIYTQEGETHDYLRLYVNYYNKFFLW